MAFYIPNFHKQLFISAQLGEKTGIAVTLARNKSTSLEVIEKRPGKIMGSRGDILFTLQG